MFYKSSSLKEGKPCKSHIIFSHQSYEFSPNNIPTFCIQQELFPFSFIIRSLGYSISIRRSPKPFLWTLWQHAIWVSVAEHQVLNLFSFILMSPLSFLPMAVGFLWQLGQNSKTCHCKMAAFFSPHLSKARQGRLSHQFKRHWLYPHSLLCNSGLTFPLAAMKCFHCIWTTSLIILINQRLNMHSALTNSIVVRHLWCH